MRDLAPAVVELRVVQGWNMSRGIPVTLGAAGGGAGGGGAVGRSVGLLQRHPSSTPGVVRGAAGLSFLTSFPLCVLTRPPRTPPPPIPSPHLSRLSLAPPPSSSPHPPRLHQVCAVVHEEGGWMERQRRDMTGRRRDSAVAQAQLGRGHAGGLAQRQAAALIAAEGRNQVDRAWTHTHTHTG